MPITLRLGLSSVIISVIIGIPLGIFSAIRQYSAMDISLTAIALVFAAVPGFVLALVLLMIFAGQLHWLPIIGGGAGIKGWILPVASSSMFGIAILIRMTRTTMLEVVRQDYIRTARAKGLDEASIIIKHALKNSLIPVVTAVGGQVAYIIAGSVIVETIFSMPGVGMYLISGIQSRDYPVINGIVIILALFICLINLLVDIIYAFIDPRIKAQYTSRSKPRKTPGKARAA
jgi:peptide/nickel transport system permease protein